LAERAFSGSLGQSANEALERDAAQRQGESLPSGSDPRGQSHDGAREPHPLQSLYIQLTAMRRECLMAVRTRYLRDLPAFVPYTDLEWLNRELVALKALNKKERPYHRVPGPEAWSDPPIKTTVLLSAVDLLPYLSDALRVIVQALMRRKIEVPDV
jgi:hypothetical protein